VTPSNATRDSTAYHSCRERGIGRERERQGERVSEREKEREREREMERERDRVRERERERERERASEREREREIERERHTHSLPFLRKRCAGCQNCCHRPQITMVLYDLASVSSIDKMTGLFCKRAV